MAHGDSEGSVSLEVEKQEKPNKRYLNHKEMEQETPEKADSAQEKVRGKSQPADDSEDGREKAGTEGTGDLTEAYELQVAEEMAKEIKKKIRRKLKEQLTYFPPDTVLHDDKLGSEKRKKKKKNKVPGPAKPETSPSDVCDSAAEGEQKKEGAPEGSHHMEGGCSTEQNADASVPENTKPKSKKTKNFRPIYLMNIDEKYSKKILAK